MSSSVMDGIVYVLTSRTTGWKSSKTQHYMCVTSSKGLDTATEQNVTMCVSIRHLRD